MYVWLYTLTSSPQYPIYPLINTIILIYPPNKYYDQGLGRVEWHIPYSYQIDKDVSANMTLVREWTAKLVLIKHGLGYKWFSLNVALYKVTYQ